MQKTSNSTERYYSQFAKTLRDFMGRHPKTGEKTTQKALADFLGVRPQTVSYYCTGESLPNCDQLLKIAEYFNETADYLITGKRLENKPVRELLGLSDHTVDSLMLVKEGYFEDCPHMLAILDCLLGDKDFYLALEKAARNEGEKKEGHGERYLAFLTWESAEYMHGYLMDFFARNLPAIHEAMKKGGDLIG